MSSLHQMLLRASRHQVWRMRSTLAGIGDERLEEIANQAADEAMMAVLAKLSTFEGRSRFTTWAYKFAILQSATEVRRFAWRHREVELDDDAQLQTRGPSPANYAEASDLASSVRSAIDVALTPHQRRVTIALLVEEVPIDVLAQRLGTNRNALYKTVHDARTPLHADLIASGHLTTPHPQAGRQIMSQANTPLSPQAAQRLTLDTEPVLSRDDCFDLVDSSVEALLTDPNHNHPAMRTHLTGCAACAEEARSLPCLVAEQHGLDPAPALRRLEDDPT